LALIHGIVIQNKQGGMKKTNIFLALITFILVLYGSFLTRSGVLTDFSVHSFGSSELSQYLLGFVLVFFIISLTVFVLKMPEIKGEKVNSDFFTRENFTLFGILILIIFAVLTFIGTSSPIITGFFGEASNVSADFYNTLAAPIAMLTALLLGLAPVLKWRKDSPEKLNSVIVHAGLSLLFGVIIFLIGMKDLQSLIITVLALFAIFVSAHRIYSMIKRKNYDFGGLLTHLGVGLMIIGIITSSVYDKELKTTLPIDEKKSVYGYELEYKGLIPAPDGKDKVKIMIDGEVSYAKFYWSEYSRAYMVAPSVRNQLLRDLYISPIQIIPAAGSENYIENEHLHVTLKKNSDIEWRGYRLNLQGYDMDSQRMMNGRGDPGIAAIIRVVSIEKGIDTVIKPMVKMSATEKEASAVILPGSGMKIYVNGINVENRSLDLAVIEPDEQGKSEAKQGEMLAVEVSVKPLINILWLGTIVMIIGFLISLYHRRY
jgi:cytochrome c-type biogenesis protein CcmF